MPFGSLARQVEKLARNLARWHPKLKYWHAIWQVAMFIGTLARKNEKLAHFLHIGTQVPWYVNHADTQALWHVNHSGTQARW